MNLKRKLLILLCGPCGMLACRPADSGTATRLNDRYVAFVGAGLDHPLWPILQAGAERYAHDHPPCLIRTIAPEKASSRGQVEMLRGLLGDLDLRGICVQVIDPQALTGVLEEAGKHGVPVVAMMKDVPFELRIAYCGVDEKDLGRSLAVALAEAVNGSGNAMVLLSTTQDPRFAVRLTAFQEQVALTPDVQVLAYAECGGNLAVARREMREGTRRYPSLSAWVMFDNWAFSGVRDDQPILDEARPVIAVDPFPRYWHRLVSGECAAFVGGDYGRIGYEAMRCCETATTSELIHRSEVLVPAEIVRSSDFNAYRLKWIDWSSPVLSRRAPAINGSN